MTYTSFIVAVGGIALVLVGFGCEKNSDPMVTNSIAGITYTNDAVGYSVIYPTTLTALDAAAENADLALGFGQEYFVGTNLKEAMIRVAGRGDEYVAPCLKHPYTSLPLTETAMINGVTFHIFDIEDAGAGQRYYYRGYRTLRDDTCIALDLEAHSTNPDVYDSSERPREFNKREIVGIFDALAKSFKFTK